MQTLSTTFRQGQKLKKIGIDAEGYFSWCSYDKETNKIPTDTLASEYAQWAYLDRLPAFSFCELFQIINTVMPKKHMAAFASVLMQDNPAEALCDHFFTLISDYGMTALEINSCIKMLSRKEFSHG